MGAGERADGGGMKELFTAKTTGGRVRVPLAIFDAHSRMLAKRAEGAHLRDGDVLVLKSKLTIKIKASPAKDGVIDFYYEADFA